MSWPCCGKNQRRTPTALGDFDDGSVRKSQDCTVPVAADYLKKTVENQYFRYLGAEAAQTLHASAAC